LWYTNARSIQSKINELNATAIEDDPDIILLVESWCSPEINNSELALEGYNLEADLRRDRADTFNGLGGGLLVYSKSGLALRKCEQFNNIEFNQYCAFIVMADKPVTIILTYRPPNSGKQNLDMLCEILRKSASENTIAIGDFNLPDIDWATNRARPNGKILLNTMNEQNYEQLVKFYA
jgi:Endonuclease-reverse transcriptase